MPAISSITPAGTENWDLESLLGTLPYASARLAMDGSIRSWNRAGERLLGYRAHELIGCSSTALLNAEMTFEWTARLAEVRSTGIVQNLQSQVLRKDGTCVYGILTLAPIIDAAGTLHGFICTVREAGGGAREQNLLHWRQRVESAIRSSRQILREWNPGSDEICCSGYVEGLLGVPAASLCGSIERWADLLHVDDRDVFLHEFEAALTSRTEFDLQYRIRHSGGTYTVVRDRGHLVLDRDDRVLQVVAMISDISELRALEDRLRHSQKMEAFGRLAGGVAHDFNNLLTVISGYTEMMKEEFSGTDSRRGLVLEVEKAAARAASLTGQLLAFSRQQVLKLRVLSLNDVLTDVGKMLRRLIGEHIKLVIQPGEPVGRVRADLGQLEQVLINLAVNARDAMPNGGTLQISTGLASIREPVKRPGDVPPGDYVLLSVADTGMGMAEEVRTHIFEPFFTTKAQGHGTGLGLATCYGIINQCGGYIAVASTVGEGTTFKIYLPRIYEAEAEGAAAGAAKASQGGSESILLVEDDNTVRKLSASVLGRLGYHVLEAGNGEEALALLAARDVRLDLLITDMVMPKMGGRDLAAQLSARYPEVKVLFTSGYPTHSVDPSTFGNRVGFIQKPFVPKTLAAQVRAILDNQNNLHHS